MLAFSLVWAAIAAFFAWYARVEIGRYPVKFAAAWSIYACFVLLAGMYLAPGFITVRTWARRRVPPFAAALVFLIPYLIYCAGTGDFRLLALAKLIAMALVPLGIFAMFPVAVPKRINWQDGAVLLWLYIPVQFHFIAGIWTVPVNLDFMARLFVVAAGAWAFIVVRGVPDAGYEFALSLAIVRDAAICLAGFSVLALPLGIAMRFLGWNPQWHGGGLLFGLPQFLTDYVTLFLFVAIAEELFFRGLLQNLLEGSLGELTKSSRSVAQAIVSVVFGLSHIGHAPAPNWRYVALATIAGWFYGLAYLGMAGRKRSLMASAGCHAMVDTLWRTLLTLPAVIR